MDYKKLEQKQRDICDYLQKGICTMFSWYKSGNNMHREANVLTLYNDDELVEIAVNCSNDNLDEWCEGTTIVLRRERSMRFERPEISWYLFAGDELRNIFVEVNNELDEDEMIAALENYN